MSYILNIFQSMDYGREYTVEKLKEITQIESCEVKKSLIYLTKGGLITKVNSGPDVFVTKQCKLL